MRTFDTGAIRDDGENKIDPEACLSPLVVERFSHYMLQHCTQADGGTRSHDNWQKGMPREVWIKSSWRHFLAWWTLHRQGVVWGDEVEDVLCAVMFNVMGYLHACLVTRHEVHLSTSARPVTESSQRSVKGSQRNEQSSPVVSARVPGVGV